MMSTETLEEKVKMLDDLQYEKKLSTPEDIAATVNAKPFFNPRTLELGFEVKLEAATLEPQY